MVFNFKIIISFEIKSLFKNVSVHGAVDAVRKELDKIYEIDLPVSKVVCVSLMSLRVHFGSFNFEHQECV